MEPDIEFIEKFKIQEFLIKKTNFWIISLRPQQPTIGSLVLTLNRKCSRLAEITSKESEDLSVAFKEIERMLRSAFQPDKMNYMALMMIDEQVHFHVIPRYSKKVRVGENEYEDKQWPGPPSLSEIKLESSEIRFILDKLK